MHSFKIQGSCEYDCWFSGEEDYVSIRKIRTGVRRTGLLRKIDSRHYYEYPYNGLYILKLFSCTFTGRD